MKGSSESERDARSAVAPGTGGQARSSRPSGPSDLLARPAGDTAPSTLDADDAIDQALSPEGQAVASALSKVLGKDPEQTERFDDLPWLAAEAGAAGPSVGESAEPPSAERTGCDEPDTFRESLAPRPVPLVARPPSESAGAEVGTRRVALDADLVARARRPVDSPAPGLDSPEPDTVRATPRREAVRLALSDETRRLRQSAIDALVEGAAEALEPGDGELEADRTSRASPLDDEDALARALDEALPTPGTKPIAPAPARPSPPPVLARPSPPPVLARPSPPPVLARPSPLPVPADQTAPPGPPPDPSGEAAHRADRLPELVLPDRPVVALTRVKTSPSGSVVLPPGEAPPVAGPKPVRKETSGVRPWLVALLVAVALLVGLVAGAAAALLVLPPRLAPTLTSLVEPASRAGAPAWTPSTVSTSAVPAPIAAPPPLEPPGSPSVPPTPEGSGPTASAPPPAEPAAAQSPMSLPDALVLPVAFPAGSAEPTVTDPDALARIVAAMVEERRLRFAVVGHTARAERAEPEAAASLARQRARAALDLIRLRGPSGRRFTVEVGGDEPPLPSAGDGRLVVLRVTRR